MVAPTQIDRPEKKTAILAAPAVAEERWTGRLTPAALASLSEQQRDELRLIFTRKYESIIGEGFKQADAEKRIINEATQVPDLDVSWYSHFLDPQGPGEAPVGRMPRTLLTGVQERQLFVQFNYCRFRVVRLLRRAKRTRLNRAAVAKLMDWHRQAQDFRDRIARGNLALVPTMIRRMNLIKLDFSDLLSEGNLALTRAIDKFDVSRGFKFSTYACRCIIKAYGRLSIGHNRMRQVFPVEYDPEFEKSDLPEVQRLEQESAALSDLRDILARNCAGLTQTEAEVIQHRFALGGDPQEANSGLTLERLGRLIGVTKERVRQIQNRALEKLRAAMDQELSRTGRPVPAIPIATEPAA